MNYVAPAITILCFIISIGCSEMATPDLAKESSSHLHNHQEEELVALDDPIKEVLVIRESGPQTKTIRLNKLDSSLFIVNATKSDLITISIDFGKKRNHCASPNLTFSKAGILSSNKPIGPRDYALMCFPESGTYHIEVRGASKAATSSATVIINGAHKEETHQ
jgi:hypothetical protein